MNGIPRRPRKNAGRVLSHSLATTSSRSTRAGKKKRSKSDLTGVGLPNSSPPPSIPSYRARLYYSREAHDPAPQRS